MSYYVFGYPPAYKDYLEARLFSPMPTDPVIDAGPRITLDVSPKTLEVVASKKALARDRIRIADGTAGWGAGVSAGALLTLSYSLEDILSDAAALPPKFHWGFSRVIAAIGRMGDGLKELGCEAKTTAQTTAYEQYEIAKDAFRRELYAECLEALGKAFEGNHESPGYKLEWRFYQLKGIVELGFVGGDMDLMDLAAAEESFLLAARYARVDFPEHAGLAFLCAGWAAYCQGKLTYALSHTEKAAATHPRLGEAFFQTAKIYMALNQADMALPMLAKAIDRDRFFVLKAAGDGDFQTHGDGLRNYLDGLRKEKYRMSLPVIKNALTRIQFWTKHSEQARRYDDIVHLESFVRDGEHWPLYDLLSVIQEVEETVQAILNRMKDHIIVLNSKTVSAGREPVAEHPAFNRNPQHLSDPVNDRRNENHGAANPGPAKRRPEVISSEFYRGTGEHMTSIEFCPVPAGKFMMGKENRKHQVVLSQGFQIGKYPVTQTQWEAVMGNNPSRYKGAHRPVENVSWGDCQEFIHKINSFSRDKHFRLPTEAEWEYACRAGSKGLFFHGDDEERLSEYAWYYKNAGDQTHPVGQKKPNAWGIYDMLGNVWEWCQDWHGDFPTGEVIDPAGPESGSSKIGRGGSWNNLAKYCRIENRNYFNPEEKLDRLGFRLARNL
ncbi:MAG: formylglycine-generating enzyme family protein [Deltaproteobacteria bacterium]|nr:formylglycine-generating enzyme family protein [Deltaproteobacteria bacterium]